MSNLRGPWRAALIAAAVIVVVSPLAATAADYLKPYRGKSHHRGGHLAAYRDDRACPRQEPSEYKPRIENFHEPLCYAARPYGISTHLYDYATNLDERGDY